MPEKLGPKNRETHNRTPEWTENIVTSFAIKQPSLSPLPLSEELLNKFGIKIIVNDPCTPKQNDKIERYHRTLKGGFF